MASKIETVLSNFGYRIAEIRAKRGLTVRDASERCNMDHPAFVRIEQGKSNITLATLLKLAEGLDIHMKELLTFDY